jgi:stage IV sporulation protein FB
MLSSVLTGYVVEMLTLFGVVTIHELGHVAAAKSFGWRVRQVQLLPFGGVASVDESTNVPARQEWIVALCGPLQNVWMAGISYMLVQAGWGNGEYWKYFLQANILIGSFNLLPLLPLDGGKILLALLCYRISYHRALVSGLSISLGFSVLIILISLVRYPAAGVQLNLLVIGIFLFYTNWYSLRHLHFYFLRFLLNREMRSIRMAEEGRLPSPLFVSSSSPPLQVLRRFMREQYHLLYIIGSSGAVLQVWPEAKLLKAYLSHIGPPDTKRKGSATFPRGKRKIV